MTIEPLTRLGRPENHGPYDGQGRRVGSNKLDPRNTHVVSDAREGDLQDRSPACAECVASERVVSVLGWHIRVRHLCQTETAQIHQSRARKSILVVVLSKTDLVAAREAHEQIDRDIRWCVRTLLVSGFP